MNIDIIAHTDSQDSLIIPSANSDIQDSIPFLEELNDFPIFFPYWKEPINITNCNKLSLVGRKRDYWIYPLLVRSFHSTNERTISIINH